MRGFGRVHRTAMRLHAVVAVLASSILLAGSLTGAATAPSPPTQPDETNACWSDESGNSACAPTEAELRKLVLSKFNKIMLTSSAELESVLSTKTYESMAVPASAEATYYLGYLYTDINYTGSVWIPTTDNSYACYGQYYSYSFWSVPHNDQYSSFSGTNGCQIRLYEDVGWHGAYYGYYDCRSNLANVGFNDRASSAIFYLTGTYSCY